MIMFAGSGQVSADGPRQRNPKANRNLNNRPIARAIVMDKLKRTQERKIAFMTRQLELTPAQNERLWPVYKQYLEELNNAQFEKRQNNLNPQPNSQDKADEIDQKIVDIRRHYRAEFRKILPEDKVVQLYKSDQEFNDELVRQLREKRDEVNN
jgi:hypothetical protein